MQKQIGLLKIYAIEWIFWGNAIIVATTPKSVVDFKTSGKPVVHPSFQESYILH